MKLAIVAAEFTPDEANQLRRAMATFRNVGGMEDFKAKLVGGMVRRGYEAAFAERCYSQIEGFGSYGFPESHALSFARLVYVSSWLKCFYPAVFGCAILNAQPMGFYAPAQLIQDAVEHGVAVRPVDVNHSGWDNALEPVAPGRSGRVTRRPQSRAGRAAMGSRRASRWRLVDPPRLSPDRRIPPSLGNRDRHGAGRRFLRVDRGFHAAHRIAAARAQPARGRGCVPVDRQGPARGGMGGAADAAQATAAVRRRRCPRTRRGTRCASARDAARRACRRGLPDDAAVVEGPPDDLPAPGVRRGRHPDRGTGGADQGRAAREGGRHRPRPPAPGQGQRDLRDDRGRDRGHQRPVMGARLRGEPACGDGVTADGAGGHDPAQRGGRDSSDDGARPRPHRRSRAVVERLCRRSCADPARRGAETRLHAQPAIRVMPSRRVRIIRATYGCCPDRAISTDTKKGRGIVCRGPSGSYRPAAISRRNRHPDSGCAAARRR